MPAGDIEREIARGSFRVTHGMLWSGTRKHHRMELRTPNDLFPLMDEVDEMAPVLKALMEAYRAGQPGADKNVDMDEPNPSGKGKPKKPAKSSDGEGS